MQPESSSVPAPVVSTQTQTSPAQPPQKATQYAWIIFTIIEIVWILLISYIRTDWIRAN